MRIHPFLIVILACFVATILAAYVAMLAALGAPLSKTTVAFSLRIGAEAGALFAGILAGVILAKPRLGAIFLLCIGLSLAAIFGLVFSTWIANVASC